MCGKMIWQFDDILNWNWHIYVLALFAELDLTEKWMKILSKMRQKWIYLLLLGLGVKIIEIELWNSIIQFLCKFNFCWLTVFSSPNFQFMTSSKGTKFIGAEFPNIKQIVGFLKTLRFYVKSVLVNWWKSQHLGLVKMWCNFLGFFTIKIKIQTILTYENHWFRYRKFSNTDDFT